MAEPVAPGLLLQAQRELSRQLNELVPPGKRLLSGFMYVGSPARQMRALTDKERAYFSYSASNYVKLKDLHLSEGYAA